jgi:hypothetical protein
MRLVAEEAAPAGNGEFVPKHQLGECGSAGSRLLDFVFALAVSLVWCADGAAAVQRSRCSAANSAAAARLEVPIFK